MTTFSSSRDDIQSAVSDALGSSWRVLLFQGSLMVILGVLAIFVPAAATIAADIFVGWLLLISGVAGLFAVFSAKDAPGFFWSLLTAILAAAAGVLLIWKPVEGALSLTFVLTAFFIAEGLIQTITSIAYRKAMSGTWGWMLVSGIADLVLAAIIIQGWPQTAVWALGLLVGVNLITSGWAVAMAAIAGRNVAQAIGVPASAASRR